MQMAPPWRCLAGQPITAMSRCNDQLLLERSNQQIGVAKPGEGKTLKSQFVLHGFHHVETLIDVTNTARGASRTVAVDSHWLAAGDLTLASLPTGTGNTVNASAARTPNFSP